MGSIAAYVAKQKKQEPYRWFFLGFLFGLLAILYLCLFVKTDKPSIETISPLPSIQKPKAKGNFWFYLDPSQEKHGPMNFESLLEIWKLGEISLETYVWNETLEDWKRLKEFVSEKDRKV